MYSSSTTSTHAVSRTAIMSAASLCCAVLIAFSAYMRIPIPGSPVPLTLQTGVLLACAGFLSRGYALQMALWYIALGLVGAPFFADGCGINYIFGATGGYLLGFVAAAAIVGYGADRADRWWKSLALYLLAASVIYVPGLAQLKLVTGTPWSQVIAMGLIPFIAFDLVKAAAAFGLVRGTRALRGGVRA